jgi:O-antigen ligase
MIEKIASERNSMIWIIFHGLLGLVSTVTPWMLIAWFYFVLFINLPELAIAEKRRYILNWIIFYLTSFEILARMVGTSPFVPYELGKYLMFVFLTIGIFFNNKGAVGFIMLLLLIPGIMLGYFESGLKTLVFNALGPVNIALAIVYFKGQVIPNQHFVSYVRLLLYPLISVLAYTLIKSPALDEVEFSLNANFQTTGGFGTNQVSTVFGAAMFFMFLFIWNKWRFTPYGWVDFIIFFMFGFRGLLSFSRGGMIGGALAILIVIMVSGRVMIQSRFHSQNIRKLLVYTPLIAIALLGTFLIADKVTDGLLSLRYAGETAGTLAGSKEKSLTTLTSSRNDIFIEDFGIFSNHLVLGIGVGQSAEHRIKTAGQLPHVELSRLLSEHGLPGLIYFLILSYQGWYIFYHRKRLLFGNILLAFFILALYTTFHAATRSYFTPLLIGVSMLYVSRFSHFSRDALIQRKLYISN